MIIVCFNDGVGYTSLDAPDDPVVIDRVKIDGPDGDGDTTVAIWFHRED